MNYLWTDEAEQFRHKTLEKDISTDVCIIGGGIAGIMCAAKLTELGIDNVVFESKQIGRGITKGTTAFTDKGKVKAKKVIVATHFPFINRYGLYFMKMYQKRSYVIAYSGAPNFNCTAEDAGNGFYFRNYKDLLLIGGGDHRTGKQGGGYRAVENFAKRWFPKAKEQYRWSNQDCVSLDGIPYIGRYSPSMPNVYVATGFNLWGMTTSVAAAEILADMITGKKNVNAPVFAPDRNMLCAKLFENMGITVADMLFPTTKRCPHLGCALRKNKAEHSWDCPCHGSSFTDTGEIIVPPPPK